MGTGTVPRAGIDSGTGAARVVSPTSESLSSWQGKSFHQGHTPQEAHPAVCLPQSPAASSAHFQLVRVPQGLRVGTTSVSPPSPASPLPALALARGACSSTGQTAVSVTVEDTEAVSVVSKLEQVLGVPFSTAPLVAPHDGLVVVISGPSGVGKDAVIRRLQEIRPSLHFVVTATSRPMRPGERHGYDYFFVSRDEFEAMIGQNELLEHALVYGEYKGIPKQQVREAVEKQTDVVLRLDVQGAATVRGLLGGGGVFIFLTAESELELVQRLVGRKTEPMERLVVRVATARQELGRLQEFDYVVVNRDGCLDETVHALCSIIDAERARVKQTPMKL